MTGADDGEVHPEEFVTVNVYVSSAGRLVIVMELPDAIVVTLPGVRVMVHEPAGRPLSTTLPVELVHVG
jgi:hypothetical protein